MAGVAAGKPESRKLIAVAYLKTWYFSYSIAVLAAIHQREDTLFDQQKHTSATQFVGLHSFKALPNREHYKPSINLFHIRHSSYRARGRYQRWIVTSCRYVDKSLKKDRTYCLIKSLMCHILFEGKLGNSLAGMILRDFGDGLLKFEGLSLTSNLNVGTEYSVTVMVINWFTFGSRSLRFEALNNPNYYYLELDAAPTCCRPGSRDPYFLEVRKRFWDRRKRYIDCRRLIWIVYWGFCRFDFKSLPTWWVVAM